MSVFLLLTLLLTVSLSAETTDAEDVKSAQVGFTSAGFKLGGTFSNEVTNWDYRSELCAGCPDETSYSDGMLPALLIGTDFQWSPGGSLGNLFIISGIEFQKRGFRTSGTAYGFLPYEYELAVSYISFPLGLGYRIPIGAGRGTGREMLDISVKQSLDVLLNGESVKYEDETEAFRGTATYDLAKLATGTELAAEFLYGIEKDILVIGFSFSYYPMEYMRNNDGRLISPSVYFGYRIKL